MQTLNRYSCAFCQTPIEKNHAWANVLVCQACNQVSRIMDDETMRYTSYEVADKIRLDKCLPELYVHYDNHSEPVVGITEMVYNEASLYFFSISHEHVLIFFEYNWYHVTKYAAQLLQTRLKEIHSGEYAPVFYQRPESYIINKEKLSAIAVSGQTFVPVSNSTITIIEHTLDNELYFSFFDEHVHLQTLQVTALSTIPQLNKPILHYPLQYTCIKCKSDINIHTFPFTKSFVCTCGAAYSIQKFGEIVYQKLFDTYSVPFIPLHSTATIDGYLYEVVGHTTKSDTQGYAWNEFTLWNEYAGFLYLSEYNGHWMKLQIEKLKNLIPTHRKYLQKQLFEGTQTYEIFNDYQSNIAQCCGFFAGDVLNDKSYTGIEYIAPPHMWAFEKPQNESITAFKGEYMQTAVIQQLFEGNSGVYFPVPRGVGAAQPVSGGVSTRILITNIIIAVLCLMAVQLITVLFFNHSKVVFQSNNLNTVVDTSTIVSPPINLPYGHSNLSFTMQATLQNSWLETDVTIVNLDNGETIDATMGLEYYEGYEDGEHWTEGDQSAEMMVAYLPKGLYQISIKSVSDPLASSANFQMIVKNDVPTYWNFFMVLLILSIPTGLYAFYVYNAEYMRWSNSNYNPYTQTI